MAYSQERITGLLFLFEDTQAIGHTLFLPCLLDTTRSLQQNIQEVKADTLKKVSFLSDTIYSQLVAQATLLTNQAANKESLKVVAIETQFGRWVMESRGIADRAYVPYLIKCYDSILSHGYNERRNWTLMYVKKLNLKE
jgi:primosomal protein N''